jgi:hypothetical protein
MFFSWNSLYEGIQDELLYMLDRNSLVFKTNEIRLCFLFFDVVMYRKYSFASRWIFVRYRVYLNFYIGVLRIAT